MKLIDGMGGNPHWLYQGTSEPLGLSEAGRSVPVSSMPLKGTGEARGKPPRGPAWLRGRMVSSNEAGFNLRGIHPLTQNFARWVSQWWSMLRRFVGHTDAASAVLAAIRMVRTYLIDPVPTEEPAVAGIGCGWITAT